MGKALSGDLRKRVVDAIERGASRRAAAAHYGVSVSSAVRWHAEYRQTGRTAAMRQGGDRRSRRIEAHAAFIRALVKETPDITLEEVQEALNGRGAHFGVGTLSRFFTRHRITHKKRPRTPPSSSARTSSRSVRTGSTASSISIRKN
jgi:transposase